MKFRIMQTNACADCSTSSGKCCPKGVALAKALPVALAAVSERLPGRLIDSLREQWARVQSINTEIATIERRLASALRASEPCRQIAAIPGVGLLTATAAVAAIGQANSFASGREFAAWLGLVPRQTGTGGRVSKRGDTYLRTLLIHGARAIITRGKHSPWVAALLKRRPYSVAVAALANKLARTIWALLAKGRAYAPAVFNARPQA